MKKKRWIAGVLCATCISTSAVLGNVETGKMGIANVQAETVAKSDSAKYSSYIYEYIADGEEVKIKEYIGKDKNVKIPKSINGKKVTAIGACAFYGNTKIKSVTLPKGITTIEEYAFTGCKNLGKMQIPSTVTEFGKKALKSTSWLNSKKKKSSLVIVNGILIDGSSCGKAVTIPKGVKKISSYAFANAKKLEAVKVQNGVKEIGSYAFEKCSKLKSVQIPKSVNSFGSSAFDETTWLNNMRKKNPLVIVNHVVVDGKSCKGEITIPEGVKVIGEGAFADYYYDDLDYAILPQVTDIVISEGVTEIQSGAFYGCTKLKSIKLPDTINSIGDEAFFGCEVLEDLEIPENSLKLGENIVSTDCAWTKKQQEKSSLVIIGNTVVDGTACEGTVEIPEGVTTIGKYAFSGSKIEHIKIPGSVRKIRERAFSGCEQLKDLEIPEGVMKIEEYAFFACTALENVTMADTVTSIDTAAFCSSAMKTVTLSNAITHIENDTFSRCMFLQQIILPDTVVKIGEHAFSNCCNMRQVVFSENLQIIENGAFNLCGSLNEIILPEGLSYLGESAFNLCTMLEKVSLPSDLSCQKESVFYGTKWLEMQ